MRTTYVVLAAAHLDSEVLMTEVSLIFLMPAQAALVWS